MLDMMLRMTPKCYSTARLTKLLRGVSHAVPTCHWHRGLQIVLAERLFDMDDTAGRGQRRRCRQKHLMDNTTKTFVHRPSSSLVAVHSHVPHSPRALPCDRAIAAVIDSAPLMLSPPFASALPGGCQGCRTYSLFGRQVRLDITLSVTTVGPTNRESKDKSGELL